MRAVRVFVYGSLLVPAVVRAVLGRTPAAAPAALHDYRRCSLRGPAYPALLRAPGRCTRGAVIELAPAELRRLDRYEDDFYIRRPVTVALDDGSSVRAQTYVLSARHRRLAGPRAWSLGTFASRHALRSLRRARSVG